MGLDMYLEGKLYQATNWNEPYNDEHRDGKRVKEVVVELGYWRKHPDLHGYIINEFAEGDKDQTEVFLDRDALVKIKEAIENDALAHGTTGFFFGQSYQPGTEGYGAQVAEDLKIIKGAIAWLDARESETKPAGQKWWPSVYYIASW